MMREMTGGQTLATARIRGSTIGVTRLHLKHMGSGCIEPQASDHLAKKAVIFLLPLPVDFEGVLSADPFETALRVLRAEEEGARSGLLRCGLDSCSSWWSVFCNFAAGGGLFMSARS